MRQCRSPGHRSVAQTIFWSVTSSRLMSRDCDPTKQLLLASPPRRAKASSTYAEARGHAFSSSAAGIAGGFGCRGSGCFRFLDSILTSREPPQRPTSVRTSSAAEQEVSIRFSRIFQQGNRQQNQYCESTVKFTWSTYSQVGVRRRADLILSNVQATLVSRHDPTCVAATSGGPVPQL